MAAIPRPRAIISLDGHPDGLVHRGNSTKTFFRIATSILLVFVLVVPDTFSSNGYVLVVPVTFSLNGYLAEFRERFQSWSGSATAKG